MVYIAQQSFGFGEIDPNLRAQYESQQYQRGCRTLSNALLSDTGSAEKRWGSIFDTASPGAIADKAFEFINGYGDTFLVLGDVTKYTITQNGTVLYTSPEVPEGIELKDAASTGNELILLTRDGLYIHTFSKELDNSYGITRRKLDRINADLITSTPPVSITIESGEVVNRQYKFISNAPFWNKRDDQDYNLVPMSSTTTVPDEWKDIPTLFTDSIWKIRQPNYTGTEDDTKNIPFFSYIPNVISETRVDVFEEYGKLGYIDGGALPSSTELNTTGLTLSSPSLPVFAKINFNGADTLSFSPTINDGDIVRLYDAGTNVIELKTEAGATVTISGTQDTRYTFEFRGYSNQDPDDGAWYDLGREHFSDLSLFQTQVQRDDLVYDSPSSDWVGPYKNWTQVGKALKTSASTVTGMIEDATWNAVALGEVVTLNAGVSADWESDHTKGLDLGQVGRFKHYRDGILYRTTWFYVVDKYLSNGTTSGSGSNPVYICPVMGNPLVGASSPTDNDCTYENVLIMELASSEAQPTIATDAKLFSDGRSASKEGWLPELLVRSGSDDVQRVGMVGCPGVSTDITSYKPTFVPGALVTATTSFTNTVRHTRVVGDTNPIEDSTVFRVGADEISGESNKASSSTASPGPSAYWKLTGQAIDPIAPEGTTPNVIVIPERVTVHQERVVIAGLNSDIAGSSLRFLPSAQNLGLTVFMSKTGSTTNFDPGDASSDDGISFQISSKKGGMIRWVKSQFNTLFLGSEEEEFVITDTPITPTSINISIQSEYGGRAGANSVSFGSMIVYVQADGKTVRGMNFSERGNRFESRDLLQFARHLTKNDTIKRVEVIGTSTQRLFALTTAGKLYCLTINEGNAVFGWNEWSNPEYTAIKDIVATSDSSGNPALWVKTSASNAVLITSDDTRDNYHVDGAVDGTSITTSGCTVPVSFDTKSVSVILTLDSGDEVYIGDITVSGTSVAFGHTFEDAPTKVVVGYPYAMTLAPNIPELMVPGKGSTLGRNKNISRLRILFNQARGAKAAGYDILAVPDIPTYAVIPEASGFYSVPVVGEFGSQPTINITQSAPYGFEVSGYNAEYDFGD